MTQSIFMQALQEVVDLLKDSPELTGIPIHRTRMRALAAGTPRGINVFFARSDPTVSVGQGAPDEWQTVIQIECYAKGSNTDPADAKADALYALVQQALEDAYLPQTDAALVPGPVQQEFDAAQEDAVALIASYFIHQDHDPD